MRNTFLALILFPLLTNCAQKSPPLFTKNPEPPSKPAPAADGWLKYEDTHFSFEYPSAWKLNTKAESVMHYREVMVALNSMGRENFMVGNMPTGNGAEYGPSTTISQLEPGAVYIDVATWSGPGPGNEQLAMEDTVGDYLTTKMAEGKEEKYRTLTTRNIGFRKWGYSWDIVVYTMPPISAENESRLNRVLSSIRFPKFPAGDTTWATRVAHKQLPAEVQTKFRHVRGGSPLNHVHAQKDGRGVLVNFFHTEADKTEKRWNFLVTNTGEIFPTDEIIPPPTPRKKSEPVAPPKP